MSRKPTMCGRNRTYLPDGGCNDCAELEERITQLESCCENVQTWQTAMDAWKTTINNWKSGIDAWKDTIETSISSLQTQITSLNNWKTTINTWKNGIDTWKEGLSTELNAIRSRMTAIETWEDTVDSWKANIDTNGYNALTNKPTINGVTVQGNKTSEDYLITAISDADIETLTPIECYEPPCSDSRACYGEACCAIVGCDE